MAYGADIDALGNSHRYILSADANDSVGSNNGTNSGGVFTGSKICEDTTNSYVTNGSRDYISLPTISTINSTAQTRKAVCGWFMATEIQTPPRRIYGEGNSTTNFQFICAYGNNSMFEVTEPSNFNIQVFGPVLVPDRIYHLCGIFSGSGYDDEVKFYVDGVRMSIEVPDGASPGNADLASRGQGYFGDPAGGGEGIGEQSLTITAPINGQYSQWAMFDGSNAELSDDDIRIELFEKGAVANRPELTGTTVEMQSTLDGYGQTANNHVLEHEVAAVSGGGDFTIENGVEMDDLTSIHFRYNGTSDTLTIVNVNDGNATQEKCSAPFGGTIVVATQVDITITCKDASTGAVLEDVRIYILDGSSNIIMSGLSDSFGVLSDTYNYIEDIAVTGVARKGLSPYYIESTISTTIGENGFDLTILMVKDE